MDWSWVVVGACLLLILRWFTGRRPPAAEPVKFHVGDITEETLGQYCGYDFTKPILVAIKSKVYDVTDAAAQYAPGKPLHSYAGKEIARAVARNSTAAEDIGSQVTHDLDEECSKRLADQIAHFDATYDHVGQVVALKELTLEELAQHDGVADPSKPLYLSIKGTVFDVSRGSAFYGPDGMYPFAGKECARALALMSTALEDCNDKCDDLGHMERDTLREWEAKFRFKYPIVGHVVKQQETTAAAAAASS